MNHIVSVALPSLALALAAGSTLAQAPTFRTIALTGVDNNLGPGLGAGQTFTILNTVPSPSIPGQRQAVLNHNGDVVFAGSSSAGTGIWRHTPAGNVSVVRNGVASVAPSTGNFTNNQYAGLNLSSNGTIGFNHLFAVPSGVLVPGDQGSFQISPTNTLSFLHRTNVALPNGNLQGSQSTAQPLQNANSVVSFQGSWTGSNQAHFVGTPGSFTALASTGATLPGLNATMASFDGNAALNDAGHLAFGGTLTVGSGTTPVINSTTRFLAVNRGSGNEMLFQRGVQAPGLPVGALSDTGGTFSPSINNSGVVSHSITLQTVGGVTQADNSVIYRFAPGQAPEVAVREGAATSRLTAGGQPILLGGALSGVSSVGASAAISNSGTILSVSTANVDALGVALPAGNGNTAIFTVNSANQINVVAISGDVAPGSGGTFLSFNASARAINNNDQIAFLSTLSVGGPISTANDLVLYATDSTGQLQRIAQEGTLFEVAPGVSRTVSNIFFNQSQSGSPTNGNDGRGIFFNERNELIFQLTFTDGSSGVFVSTVPTPGAASLIGLAMIAAGRRRRA